MQLCAADFLLYNACMRSTITFYGGAGTVTGANFGLDTGTQKLLIDCGANEREDICDPKNHAPFPYAASAIDVLFVTHAHQDHIGLIPKLMREGFRGTIISTPATKELSAIMLSDALSIVERDAQSSGCVAPYGPEDIERALALWQIRPYHEPFQVGDATVEFLDAGHILGSALVKLTRGGRTIIFTGDLGNSPGPLLRDTESPAGAHYLVLESVYGDRLHEGRETRRAVLRQAIEDARARKGTLLVPCFSLERTQIILFEIHQMIGEGSLAPIPIYLDSPLAQRVSEVYRAYAADMNETARQAFAEGDALSFPALVEVVDAGQSRHLHRKEGAKVIIAGAGMSNGGRIRAHERAYLPDENASILLTGYQAPGSLGRRIQEGAKEVVIDGERTPVRARVAALTGYSGHADRDALFAFVESAHETLEEAFVVMGETGASSFLAQRIRDFLGLRASVPTAGSSATIDW